VVSGIIRDGGSICCSWMEDVGTGRGGRHDRSNLIEVPPPLVPEWFCLGMFLHVVVPRGCQISSDAGTSVVIPDPARDRLDCADDAIEFPKLYISASHLLRLRPIQALQP